MSEEMRAPNAKWLGESRRLWPDPDKGPFVVHLHWADIDGEGRLVGIDLRSVDSYDRGDSPQPVRLDPAGDHATVEELFAPITAERWSEFRFQRDVEEPRAELLNAIDAWLLAQWEREYPAEPPPIDRRGRPPAFPDSHYYKVARVVRQARANGRRDVLNAIRDAFGGRDKVTRDQADHWHKRADRLAEQHGWFDEKPEFVVELPDAPVATTRKSTRPTTR